MLSADPLPQITLARLTAQTTPWASGSIRFPAHHLSVTLDSRTALALGEPWPLTLPVPPLGRNFPIDRLAAQDRKRDARHLVGESHDDKLEGLLLEKPLRPHPQWVGVRLAVKQHRRCQSNSRAVPAVLASAHEQSVPIFQQLAGCHPSSRNDVRAIPAVAAQRRGSFGRARDRHQPRDRPVLVEPVWSDVRRREFVSAASPTCAAIRSGAGILMRCS